MSWLLALIAAFSPTQDTAATQHPVSTNSARVVAAIDDCAAASTPAGLDDAALSKLGWKPIQIKIEKNPLPGTPTVYGKDDTHPLIRIVYNASGVSACMIEGWLVASEDADELELALENEFGAPEEQNGAKAYSMRGAYAVPVEGAALGNSDFRIIVAVSGVGL